MFGYHLIHRAVHITYLRSLYGTLNNMVNNILSIHKLK
jgi:hypothetical protein